MTLTIGTHLISGVKKENYTCWAELLGLARVADQNWQEKIYINGPN